MADKDYYKKYYAEHKDKYRGYASAYRDRKKAGTVAARTKKEDAGMKVTVATKPTDDAVVQPLEEQVVTIPVDVEVQTAMPPTEEVPDFAAQLDAILANVPPAACTPSTQNAVD